MNKILEGLRGVLGVSGVIIWNKQKNRFEKLLPAKLSQESINELCSIFSLYLSNDENSNKAIIKFKRGWVVVYNHPDFALLILAKNEMNKATLNLVMKSAISLLKTTYSQQLKSNSMGMKYQPEHIHALARGINVAVSFFLGNFSRFEIADILRLVKDELIEAYPQLKCFNIDANGGVIVNHGAEKHLDSNVGMACATLLARFVDHASRTVNIAGFDLYAQTSALSSELAETGFYNAYREIRSNIMIR